MVEQCRSSTVIRRFRPHVVWYSDSNLGFQLFRWRKHVGVDYRLLFSNGGPCRPPFSRTDFVHQVAPYYAQAVAAGERPEKHVLVPYGFSIPPRPPVMTGEDRVAIRRRLGLPLDRPILLSVGWIRSTHKRMDYLIREVANLPRPRPFLLLLGSIDTDSAEILELARDCLGADEYMIRSAPYQQIPDYYRAADIFILVSLQEGFGRVFVEALGHGLPVIAHRHPVMEYVLGSEETLLDLSKPGALTIQLGNRLSSVAEEQNRERRWRRVREMFSWEKLAPRYCEMFSRCRSDLTETKDYAEAC